MKVKIFTFIIVQLFLIFSAINLQAITLLESIENTLKNQPDVLISKQNIKIKQGALQEQRGIFDWQITSEVVKQRNKIPLSESISQDTSEWDYKITFSKKFRKGFEASTGITITQTEPKDSPLPPTNTATFSFSFKIPLWKGRGELATTYQEKSAQRELNQAYFELKHTISQKIWETVITYWDYLKAYKIWQIRKKAEERAVQMVEDYKKLVIKGERPGSDLQELYANLASKRSLRIQAENELFNLQYQLGIKMGIPFKKMKKLSSPETYFPEPDKLFNKFLPPEKYLKLALLYRADLLAAKEQLEATRIRMLGTLHNTGPDLNLFFQLSYTGFKEGDSFEDSLSALNENVPGASTEIGIKLSFPLGDNISKGAVLQQEGAYHQALIYLSNLRREIRSQVATALYSLRKNLEEYKEALKARNYYEKSLINEKKKLKLGMSTIMDVITVEDELIEAEIMCIEALSNFAKELATLRYVTGTILPETKKSYVIKEKVFFTLPRI